ncbi:MAG: phosphate acyltransferase [Elusimicrobia bacterium GWF2_52_66]|nr:MAG: phosphate acyltransferase [Elusimicrobia bacterium GWA2_51_34]OGR87344.1 MAG: phosphate acyltransferase [Elusimicrobia bacterium GWF2_52_66]HAF94930.1 phosphate acyltransferase PlsX [Elusimicrobiota bacterium]HCE97496.1 phosphate acyltransferase PlsX [Elusimicrobiota bacterium]
MRIALDAHGGDFGLRPNLEGALAAAKKLNHELLLVGRDPEIREELHRLGAGPLEKLERIKVVHASQVVDMAAEPVEECRSKPDSSLMVGAELVRDGKADAFISAGNSGAIMVASLLKLKRIPGIIRPAIAVPYPTTNSLALLLDAGANMDCKPWHLVQFAVMGSIFMRLRFGLENPSVGLLSIGEEETKGNALVIDAIPLMKGAGINFKGPVEGGDLSAGLTDVVVTDGFTGNVVLKLSEGLAHSIFQIIKEQIRRKFTYKIGALLMKKIFTSLRKKMNPEEYGGAPLLGVNGVVLICHGKSTPKAIFNAIEAAGDLAASGLITQIQKHMDQVKDTISAARPADGRVEGLG